MEGKFASYRKPIGGGSFRYFFAVRGGISAFAEVKKILYCFHDFIFARAARGVGLLALFTHTAIHDLVALRSIPAPLLGHRRERRFLFCDNRMCSPNHGTN